MLVAEGSGGHVIPALEVAARLARQGAEVKVWYGERHQTAPLLPALTAQATAAAVEVAPIPLAGASSPVGRLRHCGRLWHEAQRCFETFSPHVVVGFGGWVTTPVLLAARLRRQPHVTRDTLHVTRAKCLIHEQNVMMGRANRWLSPWMDQVALSFPPPPLPFGERGRVRGLDTGWVGGDKVMTGLPIRAGIGGMTRAMAAEALGLDPTRPTLAVLGGSQGSRAINCVVRRMLEGLSPQEQRHWQWIHLTGTEDEAGLREAYQALGVRAWVQPFSDDMAALYAQSDLVIARAGASTIAELARCGIPAILIPYPFAEGHQRLNAKLVEEAGGGLVVEECEAAPERVLGLVRRLVADRRLRSIMGAQMRTLHRDDATQRLTDAILELAVTSDE